MKDFKIQDQVLASEVDLFIYYYFVNSSSMLVWPPGAEGIESVYDNVVGLNILYSEECSLRKIYYRSSQIDSINAGEDIYIRDASDAECYGEINKLSRQLKIELNDAQFFYCLVQVDIFCTEDHVIPFSEANNIHENICNNKSSEDDFRVIKIGRSEFIDWTGRGNRAKDGLKQVTMDYDILLAKIKI